MPNDQVFKELLRAFFQEFLTLFYPEIAARLDFSRVTFLDKELFTDLPEGSLREADLVAQVYTLEGEPELILLHIEVQTQRRAEFPYRMFEYYMLLRLRYKVPVFPAVLYLTPGAGGITEEVYREHLFQRETVTFRYSAIGLPDLSADDYWERDNPLSAALSALMKPAQVGRGVQKYGGLRKILGSSLDEARKSLLAYVIEIYLSLTAGEAEEYNRLLAQEVEDVKQLLTLQDVYEEIGLQRGLERGLQEGLQEGLQQGLQQGLQEGLQQGLQEGREEGSRISLRSALETVLTARFGSLPTEIMEAIDAADLDTLNDWLKLAAVAPTLQDVPILPE